MKYTTVVFCIEIDMRHQLGREAKINGVSVSEHVRNIVQKHFNDTRKRNDRIMTIPIT